MQPWFYEATAGEDDQEKLLELTAVENIPLIQVLQLLLTFLKKV